MTGGEGPAAHGTFVLGGNVSERAEPRLSAVERAKWLVRRGSAPLRPLPDFLVIGAQKSGTSALFDYICQHPGVRRPRRKELHYFDFHAADGPAWYRAQFPAHPAVGRPRKWRTGEASPFYLCHPQVPARAAALVPDVPLIAILRDPVTRAYSHYQQQRAWGNETLDFSGALAAEEDRTAAGWERLAAGAADRDVTTERFSYLGRGRYAEQLQRWLRHYPRRSLLVLRAEDLSARPAEVMARVLTHLGLPPYGGMTFTPRNTRAYEPLPGELGRRLEDYYTEQVQAMSALLGEEFAWRA